MGKIRENPDELGRVMQTRKCEKKEGGTAQERKKLERELKRKYFLVSERHRQE